MKPNLACCLIALGMLFTPLAAQEIYRIVDEHGNVTYTDQKPDEDANPIDLPELNVLGEEEADQPPLPAHAPETTEPLEFRIVSPADGDVVTATANGLRVLMDINLEVPPTAEIVLFLNGHPQEPVRTMDVTLDQVPPGEYQLRAELQTPGGRKLAGTDSVRFEVVMPGGDPDLP